MRREEAVKCALVIAAALIAALAIFSGYLHVAGVGPEFKTEYPPIGRAAP